MILPLFPISGSCAGADTLRDGLVRVKGRGQRAAWAVLFVLLAIPRVGVAQELATDASPAVMDGRKIVSVSDPTANCYPLTRPKPRRRAVGKGGPPCASNPTLRLTVQPTACVGEAVRVTWEASEPHARVFLQGIACDLPANGARTIAVQESMTLRAMATTCAAGPETTARIEVEPAPEITSFAAEHASLASFAGTTLTFSYEHGEHWTIEEPHLTDGITSGASPFGGSTSVFFSFNGGATPTLTVTGPCGADVRTLVIPGCPAGTPETQIEFTGGSGRLVIGESVTLEFVTANASRWWAETDNGAFAPASGGSGGVQQTRYTATRAGLAGLRFYADGTCGIVRSGFDITIWDCARPLIQSFTAGKTTLAVGQETYVGYVTQSRDGQLPVGTLTSSLGNAIGGPSHFNHPETRHTYTATRAGTDTVSLTVDTPCGPATDILQITVQ